MGEVSPVQLTQVLTEFYGLLETQQYMVRGGMEYAKRPVNGGIRSAKRRSSCWSRWEN